MVPARRPSTLRPSRTSPITVFLDAPTKMGWFNVVNFSSCCIIRRLCSFVFPKPMPGSRMTFRTPACFNCFSLSTKKISDLLHHIIVLRILLHRLWISLCMHQNISCIRFRTEIGKAGSRSQSTHIVDDMGSSFQRLPGYLEFGCIHREKEFWKLSNPLFEYRNHPVQLLLFTHRICPRPCRLSANINNGCSLLCHLRHSVHRLLNRNKLSPVRKRIGCGIQDTHHKRDGQFCGLSSEADGIQCVGFCSRGSGRKEHILPIFSGGGLFDKDFGISFRRRSDCLAAGTC